MRLFLDYLGVRVGLVFKEFVGMGVVGVFGIGFFFGS